MRKFKDTTLGIKKPSAWRLDGAMRRAAMTLAAVILTTITARAQSAIGSIQYNSTGGYYEINSTDNLDDLAVYVNGTGTYSTNVVETTAHDCSGLTFKMTANITYTHTTDWNNASSTENNFTAIGYTKAFQGTFDGQGHTISGIRIYKGGHSDTDDSQGLFGSISEGGATIRGIILTDARITGYDDTGGIVGSNSYNATISDCHVAADVAIHAVQSNATNHGGIVGYNSQATVSHCTSAATLTKTSSGKNYGGIVGINAGTLSHNLAIGAVVPAANDNCHGAICGYKYGSLQNNYYFACTVAGVENATNAGCGIPQYNEYHEIVYSNTDVTEKNGAVNASPDNIVLNGDGSYTIETALGWDVFCALLADNASGYFTGKTVKLDANIEVSRMAGSSDHKFTGTFNGQGHTLTVSYGTTESPITEQYAAPFRYVEDGRIENLRVTGAIETSAKYAAGIISQQTGTTTISNCRSSVTIQSTIQSSESVDGTHGGLVASTGGSGTVNIEGCVFDGSLVGASTKCWGGFVGWRSGTLTISNSLFAPEEVSVSSTNSATFARNWTMPADANCYYTLALGTAQGKEACTATAAPVGDATHAKYSVSGITPYAKGLQRTLDDQSTAFYYSGGDNVSVSYVDESGNSATHDAIALDGTESTLGAGWYYVGKDIDYTHGIGLAGNATFVLGDGKTMNIGSSETPIHDTNAINAGSSAGNVNLTIYGQSLGTGTLRAYTDLYSTLHLYSGNYTQHSGNVYLSSTDNDTPGIDVSNEDDSYGNVTLRGGTLTISATGTGSNAITASSDVSIFGGTLHAECGPTESGYNAYGIYSQSGNITLDWTNASDRIYATSYYVVVNELNPNGAVKIASGKALVDASDGNNYHIGDGNALSGEALGNIAGKTLKPALLLTDNVDNSAQIAALNGLETTAILQGRTLYKDGKWNTLCLPFTVATDGNLTGTIFEDADIRMLDTGGKYKANGEKDDVNGKYQTGLLDTDGTMHIYFEPKSTITAYKPYIVKWSKPENYEPDAGHDIHNPVFTNVEVNYSDYPHEYTSWEDNQANNGNLSFVSTGNGPVAISVADKTRLYLGGQNKLYWPSETNLGSFPYVTTETATTVAISHDLDQYPIQHLTASSTLDNFFYIGPFRAYFRLNHGLSCGEPANGSDNIRGFNLSFGDDDATGIISTTNYTNYTNSAGAGWYDLSGRKLQGKPTAKGVYIYNGKKRVITGW